MSSVIREPCFTSKNTKQMTHCYISWPYIHCLTCRYMLPVIKYTCINPKCTVLEDNYPTWQIGKLMSSTTVYPAGTFNLLLNGKICQSRNDVIRCVSERQHLIYSLKGWTKKILVPCSSGEKTCYLICYITVSHHCHVVILKPVCSQQRKHKEINMLLTSAECNLHYMSCKVQLQLVSTDVALLAGTGWLICDL